MVRADCLFHGSYPFFCPQLPPIRSCSLRVTQGQGWGPREAEAQRNEAAHPCPRLRLGEGGNSRGEGPLLRCEEPRAGHPGSPGLRGPEPPSTCGTAGDPETREAREQDQGHTTGLGSKSRPQPGLACSLNPNKPSPWGVCWPSHAQVRTETP